MDTGKSVVSIYFETLWMGQGRALLLIQFRSSTTEVKTLRKWVRETPKRVETHILRKIKRDQIKGNFSLKKEQNSY